MAKLSDIDVRLCKGDVTFFCKFPCYVSSSGEFSAGCADYETELEAFVEGREGVYMSAGRQGRRLASRDKKVLDKALIDFGWSMLEGTSETALFVYFDPSVSGTLALTGNGVEPYEFGVNDRHDLSEGSPLGMTYRVVAHPSFALIEVTRTQTKQGTTAFRTKDVRAHDAEQRDDIGQQGVTLAKWSICTIGSNDWSRLCTYLRPYTEAEAARVVQLVERLALLGLEMAALRDEDAGDLWSSEEGG